MTNKSRIVCDGVTHDKYEIYLSCAHATTEIRKIHCRRSTNKNTRIYYKMNNNHRYRAYTVPGQLILLRLFASMITSET